MITKRKLESELSTLAERIQVLEDAQTLSDVGLDVIANDEAVRYLANFKTGVFHRVDCSMLQHCSDVHLQPVSWTRNDCLKHNLRSCKHCKA